MAWGLALSRTRTLQRLITAATQWRFPPNHHHHHLRAGRPRHQEPQPSPRESQSNQTNQMCPGCGSILAERRSPRRGSVALAAFISAHPERAFRKEECSGASWHRRADNSRGKTHHERSIRSRYLRFSHCSHHKLLKFLPTCNEGQ